MKKSILSVAAGVVVLCAAAFTGYKVYENHQMSKFGDLMIENLEALADEEGGELIPGKFSDCVDGGVEVVVIPKGGTVTVLGVTLTGNAGSVHMVAWERWGCVGGGNGCDPSQSGIRIVD